jgi:signal peptidase I
LPTRVNLWPAAAALTAASFLASTGCGGKASSTSSASSNSSISPPVEHVSAPRYTGYHMPSSSMEPTLHCARPLSGCMADYPDRPLVEAFRSDPARGEIVAFKIPTAAMLACGSGEPGTFIKRLIGLPGDRWREQDGFIYVNGRKLNEPYVEAARRSTETIPEKTVPENQFVVLGDNRSSSCDSRRWGTVPRKNLVGRVVKIYRQS